MASSAEEQPGSGASRITCVLDDAGRMLQVEASDDDCWGYSPGSLLGQRLVDLMHTDDGAAADGELSALREGRARKPFECRMRRPNGDMARILWAGHWMASERRLVCLGLGHASAAREAAATPARRQHPEQDPEHRNRTLRAILNHLREGVVIAAADGTLLEVNPMARRLLGLAADASLPARWPDAARLYGDRWDHRALAPSAVPLARALNGERLVNVKCHLRHSLRPEGVALSVNGGPLGDGAGHPGGAVILLRDITRRQTAEEHLHLAASALGTTAEGIFIADADRRLVSVNPALSRITGHSASAAVGESLESILQIGEAQLSEIWHTVAGDGQWQGEVYGSRNNGQSYPALLTVNVVPEQGDHRRHYVGVLTDVSRYKAYEARLEYLARHDALTGLPSRNLLEERLAQRLADHRDGDGLVAVMFIDLDNFKTINDAYGHALGDSVLRKVADRLRASLRESDLVARLGGDEFVALLYGLRQPDEVGAIATKLLAALAEPVRASGLELRVSASLGISCYPHDGHSTQDLLKRADSAMYQAKTTGRDRFAFYSEAADAELGQRLRVARDLRRTLDPADLCLHYQPRFDLSQGRILGVEALVRWRHPRLGLLTPERFIPIAEELGVVRAIDEWVLDAACRQMRLWRDAGWPLELAVNISGLHLDQPEPARQLRRLTIASGLPAAALHLELGATELVGAARRESWFGDYFSALGLKLDGTSNGSAATIAGLPIAYLKMSAAVIDNRGWLDALMRLQSEAGLHVVAERIERPEQLDRLLRAGCREGQGLWLGAPSEAAQVTRLLSKTQPPRLSDDASGG